MVKAVGQMMSFKLKILSIAVHIAALSMIFPIYALAMEPLNLKRISDDDKIYFGSRLNRDQIEKIQQIINHDFTMSKLPCEKILAINMTLRFLSTMTPIFREASNSTEISPYAKKYSSSLLRELTAKTKELNEILPYYKNTCAANETSRNNGEFITN